jgi:hypothetical protein
MFFRDNGPAFHTRVCGVDAIYVDARDSPKKQREQFFHELCRWSLLTGYKMKVFRKIH